VDLVFYFNYFQRACRLFYRVVAFYLKVKLNLTRQRAISDLGMRPVTAWQLDDVYLQDLAVIKLLYEAASGFEHPVINPRAKAVALESCLADQLDVTAANHVLAYYFKQSWPTDQTQLLYSLVLGPGSEARDSPTGSPVRRRRRVLSPVPEAQRLSETPPPKEPWYAIWAKHDPGTPTDDDEPRSPELN
jgi:hypothetical protein